MHKQFVIGLGMLASFGLGAITTQGLHAQAKPKAYTITEIQPKAYTITEIQVKDAAAIATYAPKVQAAIKSAGGRLFNTAGGKIVTIMGAAAPTRVAISEWDSLEKAEAFYKSKGFLDLASERDKAETVTRLYAVEALPN